MGLWLPGSLVQRVPLSEYKVTLSGTLSLMPQYTLDVILQRPFHQLRRWWLNLPNEFIRSQVPFQVTDMESGVDLPSLGKIQPVGHRRHDPVNSKGSHPATTKFDQQMAIHLL